jgi:hypothetical protein
VEDVSMTVPTAMPPPNTVGTTGATEDGLSDSATLPRRLLREAREVCVAGGAPPARLLRRGLARWRRRGLTRSLAEAQLALGRRMYAAGIDDGESGARIAALEETMRRAAATGEPDAAAQATRDEQLRRLAAAALEDDAPLPGADAEYERAREAQTRLQAHDATVGALREEFAAAPAAWARAVVGYLAVGGALLALARLVA